MTRPVQDLALLVEPMTRRGLIEARLRAAMSNAAHSGLVIAQFTFVSATECCALGALNPEYPYAERPHSEWHRELGALAGLTPDEALALTYGFDGEPGRADAEHEEWARLGWALWQYADEKGWTA